MENEQQINPQREPEKSPGSSKFAKEDSDMGESISPLSFTTYPGDEERITKFMDIPMYSETSEEPSDKKTSM